MEFMKKKEKMKQNKPNSDKWKNKKKSKESRPKLKEPRVNGKLTLMHSSIRLMLKQSSITMRSLLRLN
mgnify:CR=1 FL=1